jgi:hypothetical protein
MIIRKISPFSGKVNHMDLPVTDEQICRWQNGELVQHVFPHLTADQREFLMTGITSDEWDAAFKGGDK